MKTEANQMLYRDCLSLTAHLLWCYDGKVGVGQSLCEYRKYDQYSNNGAWLIRQGWVEVEHDSSVFRAVKGQWLIVKPGTRIQCISSNAELLSIAFEAVWADGDCLIDDGLSLVINSHNYPELEELALPMIQAVKTIDCRNWDLREHDISLQDYLKLQLHLLEWLVCLVEVIDRNQCRLTVKAIPDNRVAAAVRLIEDERMNINCDLDDVARAVHIGTEHLKRLFKEYLNMTPKEYRDHIVLEKVKRYLNSPGASIKHISGELGFSYLSHFSRWFKERVGVCPRDYMKQEKY